MSKNLPSSPAPVEGAVQGNSGTQSSPALLLAVGAAMFKGKNISGVLWGQRKG
jgi:hypothetical protein